VEAQAEVTKVMILFAMQQLAITVAAKLVFPLTVWELALKMLFTLIG
jgi:hypothetical protein